MRDDMKEKLCRLTVDEIALLLDVSRWAYRNSAKVTSVDPGRFALMDKLIAEGFLTEPVPPSCGFRWAGLSG